MNFWNRLRLIGSVIVFCISVLALLLALRHQSDTQDDSPSGRPHPAIKLQIGPTGL